MKQSEIKKFVKKLNVRPSEEMYSRTLTDTLEAQEIQKESAVSRPNLWRFIMESKVTKYSAAAAITLAIVLILFITAWGKKKK